MQKIILDTDIGDDVDDVLALAFALLRPELDVRAITTVMAFPERRAQIVQKLLRVLGRTEVPVAAGMALPLKQVSPERQAQLRANHKSYLPFVTDEERTAHPLPDEDAVSLMIRTIEAHPGEIAIVGIGPTTNIAAALRRRPEIAGKLRWIALMGAELQINRAEHNIACDPEAAEAVLSSGVPVFLGTWDITRRVVVTPDLCEKLRTHGTPLTRAITECIDLWWPFKGGKVGPVMYDLAPLLWSFDRGASHFYDTRSMRVRVETRGEWTRGMTVSLGGNTPGEQTAEVTVGISEAQAKTALDLLMKTLLRE